MATHDDDEYEYVLGTYKFKKGSTPDQSRENPDAWRGTLRDDEGHLSGHAEFIPGRDEDTDDWDPEPVYIYVSDDGHSRQRSAERTEMEELLGNLVILGVLVAFEKAKPHVKAWLTDKAIPAVKSAWSRLARRREAPRGAAVVEASDVVDDSSSNANDVEAALEAYKASMSSAEARDRFVAALVARMFSEEQLRILRDSRIDDGDSHELERASDVVTGQQVGESITLMLQANPSLLNDETLAELGKILGVAGHGREYVPVRRAQITEALRLPGPTT